jgi:hypothetical protein
LLPPDDVVRRNVKVAGNLGATLSSRANQPDGFVFELSGEFLLGYGHGVLQCESH